MRLWRTLVIGTADTPTKQKGCIWESWRRDVAIAVSHETGPRYMCSFIHQTLIIIHKCSVSSANYFSNRLCTKVRCMFLGLLGRLVIMGKKKNTVVKAPALSTCGSKCATQPVCAFLLPVSTHPAVPVSEKLLPGE